MADIEFTCPNCDQVLEADEEMAGDTIECPECNAEVAVPSPKEGAEGNGDAECPNCGAPMGDAVLCEECGYNARSGRHTVDSDEEEE